MKSIYSCPSLSNIHGYFAYFIGHGNRSTSYQNDVSAFSVW